MSKKPVEDLAIVRHTAKMYDLLHQQSNIEELPNGVVNIFRGKVTEVFRSSGIGSSYYTEIFRQLEDQGCVSFLQRGSKSVDTVIILHRRPTAQGYRPPPKSDLTNPERYANLREDVEAVKTLIGGIHIAEALLEVEKRFKEYEGRIAELEAQVSVESNKP
jgi:hypothetical protein